MNTTKSTEAWFAKQKADGLVDIKLAISNTRGASVRTVLDELLNIEVLASAGRTHKLPSPEVVLSDRAKSLMDEVTI